MDCYWNYRKSYPRRTFLVADINSTEKISACSAREVLLRNKLASLFHIFDRFQEWTEGIYTHSSVRLTEDTFLLNPFGIQFGEVTASKLTKVDLQGRLLDAGSLHLGANAAGCNLHSAIYSGRPDVNCVIHLHPIDVAAVSAMKCGLLPVTQECLSVGPVSTHDFRGLVNDQMERESFLQDMLPGSHVMLLRNHGFVVIGESIEEAFYYTYYAAKACTIQVRALAAVGGKIENLVIPSKEIQEKFYNQCAVGAEGLNMTDQENQDFRRKDFGAMEWDSWMRLLESEGFCTGYADYASIKL